jgi:molybdopterin molybdotransferase
MIELTEALQSVLDSARPLGSERVDLADALGRVLAEDAVSDIDMPPFDKATVDGFACRRADLGSELAVIETIQAGATPGQVIGPNQCARIMTGAPVPQGADCVIMVEQTETVAGDKIRPTEGRTSDHICRRAQDVHSGQAVLLTGTRVGPQHIAALASVGCVRPLVAARPRVGIVAGGDELVEPAATPGPAQIRNSNSAQLTAQLRAMGIAARDYGVMPDDVDRIDHALRAALAESDVLLISGGVSVGESDLVPGVLRQNNVRLLFDKIAVQPGKPTLFGTAENAWCFGLPGNPVSTFAIFELLVKPFLYKLMGHDYSARCVRMRLDTAIDRKDADRQSWIPVRIVNEGAIAPVEYHGSGHLLALCGAHGLISMEIGVTSLPQGMPVRVRLF